MCTLMRKERVFFISSLGTIASMNPFSSWNSALWKPSGSFSPMVPSITRGPAKPIRAPFSLRLTSPSMAKEAVTPPVVGWVRTMKRGVRVFFKECCRRTGLGHLHEGEDSLLHACTAAGGEENDGFPCQGSFDHRFSDLLTDDRSHGTSHEVKGHDADNTRLSVYRGFTGDDGLFKFRFITGLCDLLFIAFKPDRVWEGIVKGEFLEGIGIGDRGDPFCRGEPVMVSAFRTHLQVGGNDIVVEDPMA